MPKWSDVDETQVEVSLGPRIKFSIDGAPLRFQIPTGITEYGIGSFKSFQVKVSDSEFIEWFRRLEKKLVPHEPFKSNLENGRIRIKVDEQTLLFDPDAKYVAKDLVEGMLRGRVVAVIIEIKGSHFYKGEHGLTIRAHQIKFYEEMISAEESFDLPSDQPLKGCAFLPFD
jgi:hypothetical protein